MKGQRIKMGMSRLKSVMKDCDRLELEWNGLEEMRRLAGVAWLVTRTGGGGLERKRMDRGELTVGLGSQAPSKKPSWLPPCFLSSFHSASCLNAKHRGALFLVDVQTTWQNQPCLWTVFKAVFVTGPVQENSIHNEDSILLDLLFFFFFALFPSTKRDFKTPHFLNAWCLVAISTLSLPYLAQPSWGCEEPRGSLCRFFFRHHRPFYPPFPSLSSSASFPI